MLLVILLVAWCFASWAANITFCGILASEKNYPEIKWLILGAIFPIIALIAIAGLPDHSEKSTPKIGTINPKENV